MRLGRLLATAALLATSIACSSEVTDHRVGAVAGAEFWTVPAGVNPADAGTPGAVGDIRQTGDSTQAFVRYGTANNQWQAFPSVAATPTTAGLMTAAQAAAVQQGHIPVSFDSRDFNNGATLNLLTTTSNYLLTPSLPGYYCLPLGGSAAFKFVVTAATGSTPVAPTGNYGNNSTTRNNYAASGSGVPIANTGFSGGPPYIVNMSVVAAPGPLVDLTTPIGLDVTVAGTTATTWAGYVVTTCYLRSTSYP